MVRHQSSRLTRTRIAAIALVTALLVPGCSERETPEARVQDPVELAIAISSWQKARTAPMVLAMEQLAQTTGTFIASPDTANRLQWQSAWMEAHETFLAASILHPPATFHRIDAWPIEAGFVDSLPEYPGSGIVSDATLEITTATLSEQHQITDEAEVALGFHVLEYYAFERDPADFTSTSPNYEKRQQLVQLVAELLLQDIASFAESLGAEPEIQDTYPLLLSKVQRRLQLLFSEFNLLGEHSPYSKRSSQNVSTQLRAIAELLDEPVGLNHFLIELNHQSAQTFNETLNEALTLLPAEGVPDEETSSRLLLLIASLSQQLGDLVAVLPAQGEV